MRQATNGSTSQNTYMHTVPDQAQAMHASGATMATIAAKLEISEKLAREVTIDACIERLIRLGKSEGYIRDKLNVDLEDVRRVASEQDLKVRSFVGDEVAVKHRRRIEEHQEKLRSKEWGIEL